MKYNNFLVLILLVITLACVRYSFKGALPSYLETIYIADFEDQSMSGYPMTREEFMQKVTQEFIQDNSLRVIEQEEGADLVLTGAITSIDRQPVSITQQERVQEFHMVVTIKAECLNTKTDKPLWSGTISRFGVISETALREEIEGAISEAIDQLVEDVLTKTIAAW